MAIDYLSGGESITASRINEVFAELDQKLTKLFNGHTFAPFAPSNLSNNVFYFTFFPRFAPFDYENYSHSKFETIKNAATVDSYDEANKLALVTFANDSDSLAGSLEAHKLGDYWIKPEGESSERVKRYDVADVWIENVPFVLIKREWNKYNFFRFHNLSKDKTRVVFEGDDAEYNIGPFGIKSVRRSGVGGTYNDDLNYLWKAESGDPHSWIEDLNIQNNVISPGQVLKNWVEPFAIDARIDRIQTPQNLSGWGFHLDPENNFEVSDYESIFATPDKNSTLSELVHHQGSFFIIDRTDSENVEIVERTFEGRSSLDEKLAGFATIEGDTIEPLPGKSIDIVCTATNFLKQGGDQSPFTALPATLESNVGVNVSDNVYQQAPETFFVRQRVYGGGITDKSDSNQFQTSITVSIATLDFKDTVGSMFKASGLDEDSELNFTPSGWCFTKETEIDLAFPLQENPNLTFESVAFDGLKIKGKSRTFIDRHSWPTIFGGAAFGLDESVIVNGVSKYVRRNLSLGRIWLSPNVNRSYEALTYSSTESNSGDVQPGFSGPDYFYSGNGQDFEIRAAGSPDSKAIAIAQLLQVPTIKNAQHTNHNFHAPPDHLDLFISNYQRPGWYESNRSLLFGSTVEILDDGSDSPIGGNRQIMAPMLKEHFNLFAWSINSIFKIKPVQFWDWFNEFEPNQIGLTTKAGNDSGIRPRDQFLALDIGGAAYNLAGQLGIQIKSNADLPDSYAEAKGRRQRISHYKFSQVQQVSRSEIQIASTYNVNYWREYVYGNDIQEETRDDSTDAGAYDFNVFSSTHYWITNLDVKTAVEELGFQFGHTTTGIPLRLVTEESAIPTVLFVKQFETGPFSGGNWPSATDAENAIAALEDESDVFRFSSPNARSRFVFADTVATTEFLMAETPENLINNSTDDIDFVRPIEGDFTIDFQLDISQAIRDCDAGNIKAFYVGIMGDVPSESYLFLSDLGFFERQENASLDESLRSAIGAYGEEGKPPVLIEQDSSLSTGQQIDLTQIIEAPEGRKQKLFFIDRRWIDA